MSSSNTVVLERPSVEGAKKVTSVKDALDWAFVQTGWLIAGGPEHLADYIAGRTGADATLVSIELDTLLESGRLKHSAADGGGAKYWLAKPGEKLTPRKKRVRTAMG